MTERLLSGRYRLGEILGRGGMGTVHRAFDLKLKRDVAVKILNPRHHNSEFLERFQKESEWMAGMSHPNIVTVYDAGECGNEPFLVLELLTGKPLLEFATAPLNPSKVCDLALPLCRGMAYSHAQGILHRDLTLKNIMVDDIDAAKPVVKILDFGLAKLLADGQETTRQLMGTPYYISPEQINGRRVDFRVDLFAFGVCLYRLLNFRFPFEAEHPTATVYQICNEPPADFLPGIPAAVRSVVLGCLEKNPDDRPGGFQELAEVLEKMAPGDVQDGLSVTAPFGKTEVNVRRSEHPNPYLNRVMIRNPGDFFGRNREIRRIYSRLDAPHPQSISIVGERRIGKSSLLNFIYNRSNRQKFMTHDQDAIFVYLDFQSRADFTVEKFINFLSSVFRFENRSTAQPADHPNRLDWLQETVRTLHESGKRVILLMDEFERITRNPNFDEGFFSFLRSLANSYRVAYITSSCDELQNMCHNKDISDSPFFNIFSNLPLRPLLPEEADRLITEPSERFGIPLAPHRDRIVRMAGFFPFFLQIACSALFEHLAERPDQDPDWEAVDRAFLEEAGPHFEFVWEQMDGPEKENLNRIAAGQKISRKYAFVNEGLQRRGYLVRDDGGWRIVPDTLRGFIQKKDDGMGPRSILSIFRRKNQ